MKSCRLFSLTVILLILVLLFCLFQNHRKKEKQNVEFEKQKDRVVAALESWLPPDGATVEKKEIKYVAPDEEKKWVYCDPKLISIHLIQETDYVICYPEVKTGYWNEIEKIKISFQNVKPGDFTLFIKIDNRVIKRNYIYKPRRDGP